MPTIASPMAQPKVGRASIIANVICPVTVIHGEQDWVVPIAHAHHNCEHRRKCDGLKTYPQHGHSEYRFRVDNRIRKFRS